MTLLHTTPAHMLSGPWKVVVVGAGGTGSALLPSLHGCTTQ